MIQGLPKGCVQILRVGKAATKNCLYVSCNQLMAFSEANHNCLVDFHHWQQSFLLPITTAWLTFTIGNNPFSY